MKLKLSALLILLHIFALQSLGQDLNNFEGLYSSGKVPDDFTTLSTKKAQTDIAQNDNKKLDKEFFLNTRFYIDQLLLSGKILFNEPVSKYLNKVAKYVLRREKDLYKKLRFYVIKSNEANAFSTDQGIIFFTTGLLAQLESEAQLAFILCHEISHFTEKHVQEGYVERQKFQKSRGRYRRLSNDDAISQLSTYSQDNELEADIKGLELYKYLEYDEEEVYGAFEVLLYSYLPFEDLVFDTTFFDTDIMKIPGQYFPDTINQISLEKDFDDEGSTHPNIEKRIEAAVDFFDGKKTKGDLKYKISKEEFIKIKNLARFETININLADREYGDALYNVYTLQKEFPDNRFLNLSFVKALYGLAKYKNHGRYYDVTRKPKKVEGESFKLHAFIKNIEKSHLNVITYRHLHDMSKKYPSDEIFQKYFLDFEREFVSHSKVDFKNLKDESFDKYMVNLDSNILTFDIEDSIKKIDESDLSKYKKIRLKKKLRNLGSEKENLDANEEFHLFALHDLVKEEDLIGHLSKIEKEIEEEEELAEKKKIEERKQIERSGYRMGIKKLLVIDPIYENYKLNDNVDHVKSEDKKIGISEIYEGKYKRLDLETNVLDSKDINYSEVEKYNELGLIKTWMSEILEHDDIDMISSCNDQMKNVSSKYGTSKYLFSGIYGYKERNEASLMHLYGILLVYTAPIALADLIVIHHYFEMVAFEIDAENDEIEFAQIQHVNLKGINTILRAYIYNVLYQLNADPK